MILHVKNFGDFFSSHENSSVQEIAQISQNKHFCCSLIIRSTLQVSLLFQEISYPVSQTALLELFPSYQCLFSLFFFLSYFTGETMLVSACSHMWYTKKLISRGSKDHTLIYKMQEGNG